MVLTVESLAVQIKENDVISREFEDFREQQKSISEHGLSTVNETAIELIAAPNPSSSGAESSCCTFDEFVRLKREIKCLKLEVN